MAVTVKPATRVLSTCQIVRYITNLPTRTAHVTVYRPEHKKWHDDLAVECTCQEAWSGRGMVDSGCYYHKVIEAVEFLRETGWIVHLDGMECENLDE